MTPCSCLKQNPMKAQRMRNNCQKTRSGSDTGKINNLHLNDSRRKFSQQIINVTP